MSSLSVVRLQGEVFDSITEVCSSLTADEWATQTDCPGWSVQDNISHLIGIESTLLGRPAPEHAPGEKPWVKNPIGANNEIHVDYRRDWAPEQVLNEWKEVTSERMAGLNALSEEDLGAESWTPVGPGTVGDLLAIRIMDCWVHEQDIRRATNKPGNLDGDIATHVLSRHSAALPYVVGKKAGAPDGSTVIFDITGPAKATFTIGVEGKRAKLLDEPPAQADVTLSMDLATFNRLCCGRGELEEVRKDVQIAGDEELGRRIVDQQNFMI